ncbi:guanine nucleotide-binding protein G(f) subunit alpha-like [Oratosquilla oratoria]|uniref:guanine nucleotide-binding protein G(f) subunit alpha-like n=1 Tax=Oratosquilla oratoria TaxID=337810 RepID=UPI003F76A3B7
MICGGSNPERQASKKLEKKITLWMQEYNRSIKILLLGAGESGKTTVIKQMKILHINGFTEAEKKEKIRDIHRNVLESIQTMLEQMEVLNLSLNEEDNMECVQYMKSIVYESFSSFDEEFFGHAERLWADEGVQRVYNKQNQYNLIDCAKYFLDRLQRIRQEDYVPTVQDILHCRKRTTDIQKIEFHVKVSRKYGGGSQTFWMFDVGGQRGERKKWIQVFDGIHTVLFLVSASSFDLVTREDSSTNRLQESLGIFENVWNSRFLKGSGFIVFLNKQDVLKEKVMTGSRFIGDYFSDYHNYMLSEKDQDDDEPLEYQKVRCFIRDKFLDIARAPPKSEARKVSLSPGFTVLLQEEKLRECYTHFTTATDTNNIKRIFEDVHNMIIMWNLSDIGVN